VAELKKFPWIILIFLHLLFAGIGYTLHTNRTADSSEYLCQAENITKHLSFYCGDYLQIHKPEWYSLRPPGYGLFLAILKVEWLVIAAQIALSMFSILLAYRAACLIAGRKINVWLFLLPFTAFVPQFIYSGMVMSEMLLQICWMGVAWCGWMFHHTQRLSWIVFFQILLTLAMLIKPVVWLFPVFAFPMALWMVFYKGFPKQLLLTFMIPFGVIAAMFIRNDQYTGVAEYSSVSRKLLINYNVASLLTAQKGQSAAFAEIDSFQNAVSLLPYEQKTKMVDGFVKDKIASAPFTYAMIHLKGMLRFFLDTGRWEWRRYFALDNSEWKGADTTGFESYMRQWTLSAILYQLYCLLLNMVLLTCLFRFAMMKAVDYRDRRLFIGMILYIALLTGPSASARFRIPVFPLQLIAWGVVLAGRKSESIPHNPTFAV
jgi:hypothetical protein